MDRQQRVLMAADRMYDAIRTLLAASGEDAIRAAVKRLRKAADGYDDAMGEGEYNVPR